MNRAAAERAAEQQSLQARGPQILCRRQLRRLERVGQRGRRVASQFLQRVQLIAAATAAVANRQRQINAERWQLGQFDIDVEGVRAIILGDEFTSAALRRRHQHERGDVPAP